MPIYTKTGDKGMTGLFSGKRVSKKSPIIETLGSIDELNAWLGVIGGLEEIQKDLMVINSFIAGFKVKIPGSEWLEKEIDRMEKKLPKLRNFILPKGQIHLARAVCRRAERDMIKAGFKIIYLNRLSDYLFVLARTKTKKEIVWKPGI